jgi:hypothetical protein
LAERCEHRQLVRDPVTRLARTIHQPDVVGAYLRKSSESIDRTAQTNLLQRAPKFQGTIPFTALHQVIGHRCDLQHPTTLSLEPTSQVQRLSYRQEKLVQ